VGKIYTKTGDKGETALIGGVRVSKSSLRIDLYGEVDELNSFIGLLRSYEDNKLLASIQNQLFNLGSMLACELEKRSVYKLPPIDALIIKSLEDSIDEMNEELEPLKNFILPTGSKAASVAHLCRTVTRRVERKLVNFSEHLKAQEPDNSFEFINRLSDYFFVLSRFLNKKENITETIWTP